MKERSPNTPREGGIQMTKHYRVLRTGVSQRQTPGGPIVERKVGDVIEVGDEMAAFMLEEPEPYIESVSKRKRGREEEG